MLRASMSAFALALLMAAAPPALDSADQMVRQLKFKQALPLLDEVAKSEALDRASVLRLFELRARTNAALGKESEARAAFESLLELDPSFELKGKASPKLNGPFFEARAAVTERGALVIVMTPTEAKGSVVSVQVSVRGPAARVERLIVTVEGAGPTRAESLGRAGGTVKVGAASVKLRATVLGLKNWELLDTQASFDATVKKLTPEPVAVRSDQPPVAPPIVIAPVEEPSHRLRMAGIVTLSAGVAAGIVGAAFFGVGSSAKAKFDRAVSMQTDGLLSLTYPEAQRLDAEIGRAHV